AARGTERRVEAVLVKRLLESLCLHDFGVNRGAVDERIDVHLHAVGVDMYDEVETEFLRPAVAKLVHVAELPRGVDVEQWEGRLGWMEGLQSQMEHDGAVLADGIEHHRFVSLGEDLPHDVDGLGLQVRKVC